MPAPTTPASLDVNGRRFVRNVSTLLDALFAGGGTATGLFKVRKRGILFCMPSGKPRAFLSTNDGGFFVSAVPVSKESNRPFFMFALCNADQAWLGLPDSLVAQAEIATATLAQLDQPRE